MSDRCLWLFAGCCILILFLLGTGCTSTMIGDVSYSAGTLTVPVTCTGEGRDAFVQVTVYEIKDFHQQEVQSVQQPVTLQSGENRAEVPVILSPGSYKLYIYILNPGERQTATIRDIVV